MVARSAVVGVADAAFGVAVDAAVHVVGYAAAAVAAAVNDGAVEERMFAGNAAAAEFAGDFFLFCTWFLFI